MTPGVPRVSMRRYSADPCGSCHRYASTRAATSPTHRIQPSPPDTACSPAPTRRKKPCPATSSTRPSTPASTPPRRYRDGVGAFLIQAKRFACTPPNVSERQPRYRHGALRRRPGLVANRATCQDGSTEMDEQPYRHYWRVLYPEYAEPESTAHGYGRWKTAGMCMGLFGDTSWPAA